VRQSSHGSQVRRKVVAIEDGIDPGLKRLKRVLDPVVLL
jgi:hypothetical protein